MIYLDSAATSYYRPDCVAEAVAEAIRSVGNSSRGSHPAALAGARLVFETRQLVSELFHAPGPEQVAFAANSTAALNTALKGLIAPGDRVVTTVCEHNSVLRPLYELEQLGCRVVRIGLEAEKNGGSRAGTRARLDYAALEEAICPGTRAVAVTHASNLTGNGTDLGRIGRRCRQVGALLIVDASQTAGALPIDMEAEGIDVLCFTGHKSLLGPQGTGGLCLRRGLKVRPLLVGGSGIMTFSPTHPQVMPTALEAGTLNAHGLAGLRAALLWLREQGVERLHERAAAAASCFLQEVRAIPGLRLYGDFAQAQRAAIVSLNLGELDSGEVSDWLAQEREIYTRPGGHCAPLLHEALGTREQGAVRFSFSPFNTREEAELAAAALRECAGELLGRG